MGNHVNRHACKSTGAAHGIDHNCGTTAARQFGSQKSSIIAIALGACLWLGPLSAATAQSQPPQPAPAPVQPTPAPSQPAATQATVDLARAPANITETTIKVGVAALSTTIQLKNSGKDPRYYREEKQLTRSTDNVARPAMWKRVTPGSDDHSIPAGGQIMLELSADLPEPGVYETFIDSYGKDDKGAEVPDRRIRVLVTREADALPPELMVEPKTAAETWPWNGGPRHYILTLRNTTAKRVSLGEAQLVGFTSKAGADLTNMGMTPGPWINSKGCGSSLNIGASCPIDLQVNDALPPGEYQISIGVAGQGGGWSQRTQTIQVRASAWIAFVVIIVGAVAGAFLQAWRNRGRPAIAALLELGALREAVARMKVPAEDDLAPLIRQVLAEIDNVEARARKDIDVTADIERLRIWIRFVGRATDSCREYRKLSDLGREALRTQFNALMRGAANPALTEAERAALETLIAAFTENLDNWPALEARIEKARPLGSAIAAVLRAAAEPGIDLAALKIANDELDAAFNAASAVLPVPPGNDFVLDRQSALKQAVDRADKHASDAAQQIADQLSAARQQKLDTLQTGDPERLTLQAAIDALAKWKADAPDKPTAARLLALAEIARPSPRRSLAPATGTTPPQGVPVLDIPTGVLIPPRGASLKELQASQWKNEIVTNAIVLVATGLAGLVALWVPNATWGSPADYMNALLAGLAARVIIGEATSGAR